MTNIHQDGPARVQAPRSVSRDARPEDIEAARELMAAGVLSATPTADQLKEALHISLAFARPLRDHLRGVHQAPAETRAPGIFTRAEAAELLELIRDSRRSVREFEATLQRLDWTDPDVARETARKAAEAETAAEDALRDWIIDRIDYDRTEGGQR